MMREPPQQQEMLDRPLFDCPVPGLPQSDKAGLDRRRASRSDHRVLPTPCIVRVPARRASRAFDGHERDVEQVRLVRVGVREHGALERVARAGTAP